MIKYHGNASPDVNFKLANGAKVPASAITIADKVPVTCMHTYVRTYVGACVYKPTVSFHNAACEASNQIVLALLFELDAQHNFTLGLFCFQGSYTEYKITALPEHLPVKDVFLPSSPANSWTFGLKCSSICFCDPEE